MSQTNQMPLEAPLDDKQTPLTKAKGQIGQRKEHGIDFYLVSDKTTILTKLEFTISLTCNLFSTLPSPLTFHERIEKCIGIDIQPRKNREKNKNSQTMPRRKSPSTSRAILESRPKTLHLPIPSSSPLV